MDTVEKNEFIVEVDKLSVKFGDFFAVKNISFKVRRGEVFGFLGANGAGKTTTIRVLCGLIEPYAGQVMVKDLDVVSKRQEIKKLIGYMSQKFSLYSDLSVKENIFFAASIRKIPRVITVKRMQELFQFVDFPESIETTIRDLPQGIKQYVSLVVALIHDPEIVFLDEPTAGVASSSKQHFWSLIKKLSQAGKTIFVTTHYLDEAEYCETIAIMHGGKIALVGSPHGLKKMKNLFEIRLSTSLAYEKIQKHPSVELLIQYGSHCRVYLKDKRIFEELGSFIESAKEVEPTLEEVFIKCVEGVQ